MTSKNENAIKMGGRLDDDGLVNINILISEFGDFSDFFQEEELDFGEPPGTADSHAPVIPASNYEYAAFTDRQSTDLDTPECRPPLVGFTSLDTVEHQSMAPIQIQELRNDIATPSRFDYVTKAEAMLTFAPEYAAIEIPAGEVPTSLFTNPYLPVSKKPVSTRFSSRGYSYDVTQSSGIDSGGDKPVEHMIRCAAAQDTSPLISCNFLII